MGLHFKQDPDDTSHHYAVKRFIGPGRHDFDQERHALQRFSGSNKGHQHLVRLLLSYNIRQEYFMIFHWAEYDLAGLWESMQSDPTSSHHLIWLLEQCCGISQALCKVHRHDSWPLKESFDTDSCPTDSRNRGRHGDIKPLNILCFGPSGQANLEKYKLVVADYTLMRFHSPKSLGKTSPKGLRFSQTYRPPEVEQGPDARIDQKYDIWSLGCVFLEFLTWYLLGNAAISGSAFWDDNAQAFESFGNLRRNEDEMWYPPDDKFFKKVIERGQRPVFHVKESVQKVGVNFQLVLYKLRLKLTTISGSVCYMGINIVLELSTTSWS